MNNNDFESYANQIEGQSDNIPVSANGVYDFPYQNVIVPTEGNITMKDVNYPILGISMETGQRQMMLPGDNYKFENTQNVLEIPQFQNGGKITETSIPPVVIRNIGKYNVGIDDVDNTIQLEDYEHPGTSTIKNFDNNVLNQYRGWGNIEDFSLIKPDGNEYVPSQKYGRDEKGNYVEMDMEGFFPNGDNFHNRTYIPDNIQDQISLQDTYQRTAVSSINPPMVNISDSDLESQRAFMKQYVGSDAYREKLSNYYSDSREEQKARLTRLGAVQTKIVPQLELETLSAAGVEGMSNRYADHYGNRTIKDKETFDKNYSNKSYISPDKLKELEKSGILSDKFNLLQDMLEMSKDGVDNKTVYFTEKGHEPAIGIHEMSHYMKQVPRNQYEDILSRTKNTDQVHKVLTLEDGRGVAVDYLRTPTEVISRLDVLRYLMKQEGIKDTTKDLNVSEKDLEKALKNPRIKNNYNVRNLIDVSKGSQELLWLLNNIVDNRKLPTDNTQYMG